ncbi:MAG: CbiX/SirB N-terminal domain-containing protein [Paucibacter sp.]|nr:CbiX/SirB N-terminal domain-containing protein [Roseateles sp.]
MQGLLLFCHGARDPEWARPFEAVAAGIKAARPALPLELAFLEFMAPDLPTAAARLVAAGCDEVHIVPLFLGTGGHVRRDVPALIETLRAHHPPTVRWQLHAPIGEHAAVVQAMATASLGLLPPASGALE